MMMGHQKQFTYGSIKRDQKQEADASVYVDEQGILAKTNVSTGRIPFCTLAIGGLVGLLLTTLAAISNPGYLSVSMLGGGEKDKKLSYSAKPRFYKKQLVDHFDESNEDTWSQQYFARKKYFKGPGHPIFLTIGGEGSIDGLYYPFVEKVMAKKFGAYVLHPEHRFYGVSQPVENATIPQLLQLLTPHQAMEDMLQLAQHYRKKLGCSSHKLSKHYCPIMVTGGSYPGFLSAMMRFLYPEEIQISYASSAPLLLYSKDANPMAYFDIVTAAAEKVSPGCRDVVKRTLLEVDATIQGTPDFATFAVDSLNICDGSIPIYIQSSALFSQEIMQLIETSFADFNMIGNYPPSNHTRTADLCHVFQDGTKNSFEKVREFWNHLEIQDDSTDCFVMDAQLSEGDKATVSSADFSGLGPGRDGRMWDFQCCTSLTPEMGFSEESMFPKREWTYDFLTDHCVNRFGVVGDPFQLVNKWHFNDLVGEGASRIIFTNGGNDMWSAGSYTKNLSESIVAINMPNGAHHSELGDRLDDTDDIKAGREQVASLVEEWLHEIKHGHF